MLSEKRHRDSLNADVAGVVVGDQRILESNLTGESSRVCVRGGWPRLGLAGPVQRRQHAGERSDEPAELAGGRTEQALHRARGTLELVRATEFA